MKAAYYQGNRTFTIEEGTQEPLLPGMVRLKVAYCGVCGTDVHIYHGKMDKRVQLPQVIGHEVSGEVVEIAPDVTSVKAGQKVAVRPLQPGEADPSDNGNTHIGKNLKFIGIDSVGGMQSYWNVPAHTLHLLPEALPLHIGALIEPLAVACHDVRMGELQKGEYVVVIGGGPIGLLIALVAQFKGALVLISEPNAKRLELCQSLGLQVVNPMETDVVKEVESFTKSAMADVVFEVSGVQAGVQVMTQLPRARGRIVMVAIHSEPKAVDLFRFFWRELKLIGARVYEPQDFEEAIRLAASGVLPLDKLITQVSPLKDIQQVFETIDQNPAGMKYLLDCQKS
ncbi:alcohol dehydrogenase catalytic domain-containing protein [Rhodocytophaga aerolata]|uniref:Alcohol dehydrogenase catalytic domain-containing protein n=1 Tax=Rhodocytophaga aerolata TaxID=455078 RepID=A0ABT8RC48_9BACT|nr:alcohol dehydrogenase catalytic domain-containing protein [Rhodocytophaga aerolata]MDO1449671.1 alcohol dehydrogenase catalytic domain-containing protein [Rhodocytophaga aerolata]